jgi:hypothetical protein
MVRLLSLAAGKNDKKELLPVFAACGLLAHGRAAGVGLLAAEDELLEQKLRESGSVMADHAVLFHDVVQHALQPHALKRFETEGDRLSALGAIAAQHPGRDRPVVDHHPVKKSR